MDWPAILTGTKDVVTACAAAFAAYTAWRALNRWQSETIGKRRLEVAGDALAAFYQMREIIKAVRAPLIEGWEMKPAEDASSSICQSPYHAILNRLSRHSDNIGAFFSKKHIFSATFGPEYEDAWNDINGVLIKINVAADMLISNEGRRVTRDDPSAELYLDLRHVLARTREDDEIEALVDAATVKIEKVCRPIIGRYAPKP